MKKKYFNDGSLRQLADSVNAEIGALALAVADALGEIQENMEALEKRVCGYSYDAEDEKIILPQPAAAADREGQ